MVCEDCLNMRMRCGCPPVVIALFTFPSSMCLGSRAHGPEKKGGKEKKEKKEDKEEEDRRKELVKNRV
eukprot:845469-Rhodomonas_salina.2